MKSAVVLVSLLLLAATAVVVRADDFDDDFAPPPTRNARGGGAGGGGARASARSHQGGESDGGGGAGGGDGGGGAVATAKGERRGVEEITFVLEHSLTFDDPDPAGGFKPCGVFNARAHYDKNNQQAVRLSHVKLQRDAVDDDFAAAFSNLVEADLHYRVRVPANVLHPRQGEHVMVRKTSIKI